MNRQEAFEAAVDALETRFLRTEFGEGEFRILHNQAMGTISIVHDRSRAVMTFMDVTGSHFTGGEEADARIHVHLPLHHPFVTY